MNITTRRKDVIAKFASFVKKLDTTDKRTLYDVLALIRGPDFVHPSTDSLKHDFTCRIRYMLGFEIKSGDAKSRLSHTCWPAVNGWPWESMSTHMKTLLKAENGSGNVYHYTVHAKEAINRLTELGYIKETS